MFSMRKNYFNVNFFRVNKFSWVAGTTKYFLHKYFLHENFPTYGMYLVVAIGNSTYVPGSGYR